MAANSAANTGPKRTAHWIRQYRPSWFSADLVAGLTTAAVVVPKAMAYATVAGLPIQVGLYTAFVPMIVYAVLGTSRVLSVSTTTTIAILTATQLGVVVPDGNPEALLQASALLTLMVGIVLILAGALRLGFVANFISEPVLVGFKAGIGVVIIVDQIPKLLGLHFPKAGFLHNLQQIVTSLSHTSIVTLAIGIGTIVLLGVLERVRPKWPAPLIVIVGAIAGAAVFGWQSLGVDLVGSIPSGLPPFTVPSFAVAEQMWPGAIAIALMSFTETIAVGRAFAARNEPTPRPNVELFATGLANTLGAFFGAMPGGGGMSQTAVNRRAGAMTNVAGLVTAVTTLLTMFLLAPYIGYMPQATLAGIVIVYSVGLIQVADFRDILRIRRTEFVWAAVAFLGVMLLGTLKGIVVAIVVSLIALAQQVASPPVRVLGRKPDTNVFRPRTPENPEDEVVEGLLLVRLEGRLFFLNAERIADKLRALLDEWHARVVVLDFSNVFDLEYSALKMLNDAVQRQREAGIEIWLTGLSPEVYEMVQRSPLAATLGRERMLFNLELAVAKFQASADR